MVNQKLGFITVAICFGYITTLTGLQGIKWRRNIAENFNRLSRAHERYRQTDRRQTDDRQTDDRRTDDDI